MKKLLLSLSAICASCAAFAQAGDSKIDVNQLRFGAYIAPNISWMHPTASKSDDGKYDVKSEGSKVGYTWGLMIDYFFADNYGLVTGFQLNTTGGKITATNNTADTSASTVRKAAFDYSIQYLEIPLALKLRTDEISGFRFFGQIGVTAGANIGKKATYNVDYYDASGKFQNASEDKVKMNGSLTIAPLMLQLNVGGGITYPLGSKLEAYLGLFFNNGFLPDATNPDKYSFKYAGSFKDGNVRLNSFAVRLGLIF